MNAIVSRCREMRTLVSAAPIRYGMDAVAQCERAADEIERLLGIEKPKPQREARSIPTEPGAYWAKWRIADEGTPEDNCAGRNAEWEVVTVVVNCADPKHPEYLRASVPGVSMSQSLENFHWGQGPLRAPGQQS